MLFVSPDHRSGHRSMKDIADALSLQLQRSHRVAGVAAGSTCRPRGLEALRTGRRHLRYTEKAA
jgi:hypothetical protein